MGASAVNIILSVFVIRDSYGYDIVQTVKKLSGGQIKWSVASIYPVLRKLETQGMIKSYWRMEKDERPRKYYSLLEPGRKELEALRVYWSTMNDVIFRLRELPA